MPDVGEVRYKVTVDNSGLDKEIDKSEKRFKKLGDAAASASDKVKSLFSKMSGYNAGSLKSAADEAERFTKALNKGNSGKLKAIRADISSTQGELRNVNEALEKMPKSIGLVSEKYKLTKEQVRAAKEEVRELKKVQQEAKEAFKDGDLSRGAYRAIKRDVLESKASLNELKKEGKEALKEVANTAGAVTGVNKLKGALSKTGSIGLKVFKGIGTAFVGLTSAAATGVAAVAKMGIEYNSQMQSYQAAFSTMLGDAEKAQGLTNDLKEMAASTPLAMTDLADASQTLLAFGVSSDKLLPTLKNLGDVALGDSQKMQSLALAFGQMSSTGKLTGQDLLQMINAGFNPLNEISKMTGESVADLKGKMEDGAISADMVAEAFAHATSEGGQFYNAMEEQSKTFGGQMSTLKDNIAGLTGTLTEDLFAGLAENTLPKVNEWVEELTTAAEEGGVEGAIEASGTILTEAITGLLNGAPKLVDTATELIMSFLGSVQENGPEIVRSGVDVLLNLIQGLIKVAPELLKTAGVLIASLLEAFGEIDWIELGKDIVRGIIDGLVSMGSALWDAAKSLAKKALNSIRSAFDSHSPSKKAEALARTVPQGLKKEWDSDTLAEDAAEKLGSRAIASLTADVNYRLPDVGSYAKSLTADFTQSYHGSTEITVPLYLDGREVARASAWWTGEQLSWEEM